MKITPVLFLLLISFQSYSQGNQVELPYEKGKVVFRNHVNNDEKKSVLFDKLISWVKNEKSLSDVKIDRKNMTITANGSLLIPTKRSKDAFTYKFNAEVIKGGIEFWYERFLYVEINEFLEVLIEKNQDSDRRTVQENLKFIKLGINSNISSHSRALKEYVKGN